MSDTFIYIGFAILVIWCISLSDDIKKIKKQLIEENVLKGNSSKMKTILTKNIGKKMILKFDEDNIIVDLINVACEIVDVDDKWVLVRYESKKKIKESLIKLSILEGAKYK